MWQPVISHTYGTIKPPCRAAVDENMYNLSM